MIFFTMAALVARDWYQWCKRRPAGCEVMLRLENLSFMLSGYVNMEGPVNGFLFILFR